MHAERTALWERHDKWSAERAGGNFGGNFEVFFVCSPEMWAPPSRQIIPAARMKMAKLRALGEGARVASGRLCG